MSTILPSLTAITGESCLAKTATLLLVLSEATGTAAFAVLTFDLASCRTALSAYLAGAATGKWPCTRPVSASTSLLGRPPMSLARSSTDCTYQTAWL